MLSNISYRYKIPASLSLVIVVTALAIAAPLISGAKQTTKRDLIDHALVPRQDAGGRGAACPAARRYVAGIRDHHHAVRSRAAAAPRPADHRGRRRPGLDLRRKRPQAVSGDAAAGKPRADVQQARADHLGPDSFAKGPGEPRPEAFDHGRARAVQRQHAARHGGTRILARHLQPAFPGDHSQGRGLHRDHAGDPGAAGLALGKADREPAGAAVFGHPAGRSRARRDRVAFRRRPGTTRSPSSGRRSTAWSTACASGSRSRKK